MKCLNPYKIIFVFLMAWGTSLGQYIQVVDENTGFPLQEAAVYTKNLEKSRLTDSEGKVPTTFFLVNDDLIVQLNGYEEKAFKLTPNIFENGIQITLAEREERLEEIILSVARRVSTRKQIAEKVGLLESASIAFSSPSNGADLVGLIPGVRIQKSQGGGGSPILRGFEANRLLLVVDGVRMNNAIYRSGHLQNAITVDPHNIDRLEVVFGSSSVGYGSDALGGVIHYYTRTPRINSDKKIVTRVNSDFESASLTSINNISTELSFKNWASLTSISASHYGDIRMGKNRTHGYTEWGLNPFYSDNTNTYYNPEPMINDKPWIQKNTGYEQLDLFQKFVVQLPQQQQLLLNFQYSNSSNISRYDKLVELKNNRLRYAEWYYGPQKRIFFSPQWKFYPEKKYMKKGGLIFAFQDVYESRIDRAFKELTNNHQRENVKVYSLNADFEFEMPENHSFIYGTEATYNRIRSYAFKSDLITSGNNIIGLTPSLSIPTRYPSRGSSYASSAVYFNWVWDINPKITLNAGTRFTLTQLEARWKETANINALISEVNFNAKALTGTVAMTYRPNEKFQWNVILSDGFRNPNIDDVGKIRESKGQLVVPNPNLFPEYAYNFELGLTKYFKNSENYIALRSFSTLVSGHIGRNEYQIFADITTEDLFTILYNGEEVNTYANDNLGNRYLFGGSVDSNFVLARHLNFIGSLTMINAAKEPLYGPLPSISPTFGALMLQYDNAPWKVQLDLQFSGSKNPKDYSLGGEDGLEETPILSSDGNSILYAGSPAWNILSLQSQYVFSDQIRLRFAIDNLLDKHYRTFASGISSPGRNFKIGLQVGF